MLDSPMKKLWILYEKKDATLIFFNLKMTMSNN